MQMTSPGKKPFFIIGVFSAMFGFMRDLYPLIFPSAIDLPTQHRRINLIQARLNTLAWIMTIGTPLWGLLDILTFPHEIFNSLLSARLLAGAAFASFLLLHSKSVKVSVGNLWLTYAQLGVTFAIPTLFYFFCHRSLDIGDHTYSLVSAVGSIYYLLPLVMIASIGLFPLTLVESMGLAAPMLAVFFMSDRTPANAAWAVDLGIAWVMCTIAAIAVVVSLSQLRMLVQLVSYAAYDAMTACLGRGSGEEIIRSLWHASVRKQAPLVIALLDLDHFKQVNDRFGHLEGDAALAKAAQVIKDCLRKSDFVIRWGGEEFLVILCDSDLQNAGKVLSRVMENGVGRHPDGTMQTVSIGVVERIHDRIDDYIGLIQTADQRLYQAKESGRARIVGISNRVL